jgi:hypothetical protein
MNYYFIHTDLRLGRNMFSKRSIFIFLIYVAFIISCQPEWIKKAPKYDYTSLTEMEIDAYKAAEAFLYFAVNEAKPLPLHPKTKIDSIKIINKKIYIFLNQYFSYIPFREETIENIYERLYQLYSDDFEGYKLSILSMNHPIEALIPNYYRRELKPDYGRVINRAPSIPPLKQSPNDIKFKSGLSGYNIALWHSHGWYYDHKKQRWQWQRPRLFTTVEDMLPMAFTIPYLIPMLENAGALVFTPRERDFQINEIIVDDESLGFSKIGGWHSSAFQGFSAQNSFWENNINPFRTGVSLYAVSSNSKTASVKYIPEIPEDGYYGVYISYAQSDSNITDAQYTVHYAGGKKRFWVNQQIGGGTWNYLGKFYFKAGKNSLNGSVELTNESRKAGFFVSADAVRFGGGMGNVVRGAGTSGRPRFLEAGRYYLQYAGYPDSLVYHLSGSQNDYKDDYLGRGEFVNYLRGKPLGPNKDRNHKGLGIPIDLSLAFHTDAGITQSDTAIGTLSIYSLEGADTTDRFPNGVSRMANRDFADMLQTQIVSDIRQLFDKDWPRRHLRNAKYSEAYRPNVPSALLELLSHQNFADMKLGLDPVFRFQISRAIYKSILKFLKHQNQEDMVVQPMPVSHFAARLEGNAKVKLSWRPTEDILEPSANPTHYKIYVREDDNGFDSGRLVREPNFVFNELKPGIVYGFKVTAINLGGESFPSEILSAAIADSSKGEALIVNGFDRLSAPQTIEFKGFKGFDYLRDRGVSDGVDIGFSGRQNDFIQQSKYRSNDNPGHGASYANYETKLIAGNTKDYCAVHGADILTAGFSFSSCSDEYFENENIPFENYFLVDLILGEELEIKNQYKGHLKFENSFAPFPAKMRTKLKRFLDNGGNLLLSGAHIGKSLFEEDNSEASLFASQYLKLFWSSSNASLTGEIFSAEGSVLGKIENFSFSAQDNPHIYSVENPDALSPLAEAKCLLRYSDNSYSAGISYDGAYRLIALGFPYETIVNKKKRKTLMRKFLEFFRLNRNDSD